MAYAEVDVETTNFEGEGGFARADARGRYVVRGLAADRYDVCFTAVSDDLDTLTRCRRGTVDVRIGQVVRRVDGVIPTVESMTVSVVDAQGEPVAGVDAVALAPCDDACDTPPLFGGHLNTEVFASGVTDSQGAAGLNNLAPGRYAVCLFSVFATTADGGAPDGYADRCSGNTFDVIVKKGATSAVSLTLEDGGAVTGTVVDGSGNPIRGVLVHVTGSAADDYSDITDEDFFPPGLPAGVPGDPGDPTSDSVTRADGTYTVRSVPTGGAGVCAQADNAVGPNPAGYFDRCLGAANGSTSGGTRVTVRADTTSPVDDIVLSPASAISGRIVTAARRTPVPYADVVVLSAPHGYEVTEMLTDADGAYQVTRLRPGRYFVCVFSFDLQSQCYRGVPWDPHAEAPPVRGSTAVITTAGAITTGIGFRLAALKHR